MAILYMRRILTSSTSSKCICRPILNRIVDLCDWAVWGKPCVIALIDFVSTENAGPTKWQQLCDSTSVCTMPRSSPMQGLSTEISSFPTGPIPQITSSGTPPSLVWDYSTDRFVFDCIPSSGLSMFDCYSCFCLSLILCLLSVCGYKQSHQILTCIHKPSFSELCVETCPYNVHMYICVCVFFLNWSPILLSRALVCMDWTLPWYERCYAYHDILVSWYMCVLMW